jgi:hypothetical protein
MYVIKKITTISTARNGSIAFAIASTRSPETADATKSTNPIGGVANPTVRLTLIIIAKWIGSIPKFIKIGPKIGPRMIIAGPASKNIPTMKSKILIKNNNNSGLLVSVSIKAANCSGA